jgi:hypothetical protein
MTAESAIGAILHSAVSLVDERAVFSFIGVATSYEDCAKATR